MVSAAEAVAHSDFPLRSKEPELVNGPSGNWPPAVWGLNAREETGLLGLGVLCLQDGAGRRSAWPLCDTGGSTGSSWWLNPGLSLCAANIRPPHALAG